MKFPNSEFMGRQDGLVQHIDLAPTILDWLGSKGNGMLFQGKSLLPLVRDQRSVNDFVFSEAHLSRKFPRSFALRTKDYKYIELKRGDITLREWMKERDSLWPKAWRRLKPRLFYCIKEDPGEKVNVIGEHPEKAEQFRLRMEKILKENRRISRDFRKRKGKRPDLDPEVSKQLQALGYFD